MAIITNMDSGMGFPFDAAYVRLADAGFSEAPASGLLKLSVRMEVYGQKAARAKQVLNGFILKRKNEVRVDAEYDAAIASMYGLTEEQFHEIFNPGPWTVEEKIEILRGEVSVGLAAKPTHVWNATYNETIVEELPGLLNSYLAGLAGKAERKSIRGLVYPVITKGSLQTIIRSPWSSEIDPRDDQDSTQDIMAAWFEKYPFLSIGIKDTGAYFSDFSVDNDFIQFQ